MALEEIDRGNAAIEDVGGYDADSLNRHSATSMKTAKNAASAAPAARPRLGVCS